MDLGDPCRLAEAHLHVRAPAGGGDSTRGIAGRVDAELDAALHRLQALRESCGFARERVGELLDVAEAAAESHRQDCVVRRRELVHHPRVREQVLLGGLDGALHLADGRGDAVGDEERDGPAVDAGDPRQRRRRRYERVEVEPHVTSSCASREATEVRKTRRPR